MHSTWLKVLCSLITLLICAPRCEEQMGEQFVGKKVDSSEEEGLT